MQHQNPKLLQGIIITEKEEKTKATSGHIPRKFIYKRCGLKKQILQKDEDNMKIIGNHHRYRLHFE